MTEVDVNAVLLSALENQYTKSGTEPPMWSVNARPVSKFDTSKVKVRLLSLDYPGLSDKIVHHPVVLQESQIRNPTGASVKQTVTYSRNYTDSYEWNISAGLKLGAAAKFTAGLPIVGEGEVSTSVELSFAAGFKNGHSESVTFTGSVEIQIPAQTSVAVKTILAQGKVDSVPFRATLQAYGTVGAYTAYSSGTDGYGDFSWQWSDLDTGLGWTNPNFKSFPAFKDNAIRTFVVDGLFSAECGFNVNVVAEPLAALALA